jgi:hypothetical protein
VDRDGNGSIDKEEWLEYFRDLEKRKGVRAVNVVLRHWERTSQQKISPLAKDLSRLQPSLTSEDATEMELSHWYDIAAALEAEGRGPRSTRNASEAAAVPPPHTGTMKQGLPTGPDKSMHWSKISGALFQLRGKNYLSDKKKVGAEPAMFDLVGMDLFPSTTQNFHIAQWHGSVYQQMRQSGDARPFMLIINWIVPGSPYYNMVSYFELKPFEPSTDDERHYKRMMEHFLKGPDDKFRNNRFKFIPSLAEGPYVAKSAVGSKPALIAKKLNTTFHKGEDYLEVDIDVGSSKIAGSILGVCKSQAKALVIDMGFTIEGKKEAELPERLLSCMRLNYPDLVDVDAMEPVTILG